MKGLLRFENNGIVTICELQNHLFSLVKENSFTAKRFERLTNRRIGKKLQANYNSIIIKYFDRLVTKAELAKVTFLLTLESLLAFMMKVSSRLPC